MARPKGRMREEVRLGRKPTPHDNADYIFQRQVLKMYVINEAAKQGDTFIPPKRVIPCTL